MYKEEIVKEKFDVNSGRDAFIEEILEIIDYQLLTYDVDEIL